MSVVNLTSLILVAFCFKCIQTSSISPIVLRESTRKCTELGKSPYFDIDIVVGEPWRIYYTWDIHMEAKCLDFIFKNATQPITKRFFTDMYDYLETQPTWDAATMYMSMGAGNQHEILLFASQGAAGTFDGVPNVMKRPSAIAPNREGVPILKFFIKILDGGVSPQFTERTYPVENWTSCKDFLNNTQFDPQKVIDIDWKIFYFWSPRNEETYNIRFSKPPTLLVNRFKVEVTDDVKPPINWADADLFMETTIDFSALFIKTNISGLYRIIPSAVFEFTSIPMQIFALKVVEPGYLGIANCKQRYCYALAPADKMPPHYELEEAAKTLGFFSHFNRSHIAIPGTPPGMPPLAPHENHANEDDFQEDEDLDLERDPNKLEFF